MRRRARFAVLAAASLCLVAASKTAAHTFPDVTPARPLPEACYKVASLKLGEESLLVMQVENKHELFTDLHRRDDRMREDGWAFGARNDVKIGFAFEPAPSASSEDEPDAAADAEATDPLPDLVVTVHDGEDDPSAPFLSFSLDRPTRHEGDVLDNLRLRAETSLPSC